MNQEKSSALEGAMSGGKAASLFPTQRSKSNAQWQSTPNLPEKGEETIEDIFKQLLPYGKPDCTTFLPENETIDTAINKLATSEESYKMYWMLTKKSKVVNQETYHARVLSKDHAKILTNKAQTAVNRALPLLALEGNLDEGLLEHTVANSLAKRRIRAVISHEVLWEPTKNQT
jgi:hypothetical protein